MKKRAFSVIELIVAAIIVGVVIVVGIQSAKKATESYDNYFYAAYDVLSKAVYNAYIQPESSGGGDKIFEASTGADGSTRSAYQNICYALTNFINTTQKSCDVDDARLNANLTFDGTPSFTAVNGMTFYLGAPFEYGGSYTYRYLLHDYTVDLPISFKAGVVAVDLNGRKGPNTHEYHGNSLPDRVFFVLMNKGNGSVIPIGLPDVDRRYFQVRVILPEYQYKREHGVLAVTEDEVRLIPGQPLNPDNPIINKTPPMSLHNARIFAWGNSSNHAHEGFYATQPMSYHALLVNGDQNSVKAKYCSNATSNSYLEDSIRKIVNLLNKIPGISIDEDKIKSGMKKACEDKIIETYDTDGMKQILKIQTDQMHGYNYAANTSFKIKMAPQLNDLEVEEAQLGYGCTPDNSECYIIPLR